MALSISAAMSRNGRLQSVTPLTSLMREIQRYMSSLETETMFGAAAAAAAAAASAAAAAAADSAFVRRSIFLLMGSAEIRRRLLGGGDSAAAAFDGDGAGLFVIGTTPGGRGPDLPGGEDTANVACTGGGGFANVPFAGGVFVGTGGGVFVIGTTLAGRGSLLHHFSAIPLRLRLLPLAQNKRGGQGLSQTGRQTSN